MPSKPLFDETADGADESSGSGFFGRMSQSLLKPAQPRAPKPKVEIDQSKLTDVEREALIRQVDPLERKIGYLGAGLVAVVAFIAFAPYVNNPSKTVKETVARIGKACPVNFKASLVKGVHDCTGPVAYSRQRWLTEMLVVLFFAVFIAIATRIGRRSAVAFALLFGGLAVEGTTGSIIGIVFVGAGGWLIVRSYRVQKYGSPTAKGAMAGAANRPARPRRSRKSEPDVASKTPEPNKRYTPKAPERKRERPPK